MANPLVNPKSVMERLDREIGHKRHQDTQEKLDVMIGLLAQMVDSIEELRKDLTPKK